MEEKKESRRRVLGRFWMRVIGFFLIAGVLLSYATYVLTPKHDYGICSMMNLYEQEEDSVDVLAVGTSLVYAGVNTNVLWSEYGIAAYDLCSAEQPFWVSYYAIREALKTQSPQVILLDAKASAYTRDYSKRGRTILSTYGIRGLENRAGAILACVEEPLEALDYLLGLPQVHNNYGSLTAEDFVLPPDNGGRGKDWKGFIEVDEVESHQRPSVVATTMGRKLNEREEAYARKIFELCREEGIEVMLVGIPNPDYAADQMYYNALWNVAEEYGFGGIDYNDPDLRFGLRYSSDFADWQHLNVKGSVTFSRKLGEDLRERYGILDRRGDEAYASYERCAKKWYEGYEFFESA
ncbi:MAG: hypothetical protein Q4F41_00620 [Eubacteriales bacterium]|nr:hypothetical protein [Eubacteriales bacterium]